MVEFSPDSEAFRSDRAGIFRALRDEAPVYRSPDGSFIALSRYDDVTTAARNWDTFSSALLGEHPGLELMNLVDPTAHTDLRSNISRAFSPQRVLDLEPEIRAIARSLIAELRSNGSGDLIRQFTRPLTTRVMGTLLGFSDEQVTLCQSLTDAAMYEDPDVTAFVPLIQELVSDHRASPTDDLTSALLGLGDDGGEALSESAILAFCFGAILGNNCTTMNSLSNGIWLAADHPEQWRELAEDPSLLPEAFEEMMRCEPPTHSSQRVTAEDVELHGETIPAGTLILVLWGAASLDERAFDAPERFDIHRRGDQHLALGWGTHFCIGAALARLEARVAFEELVTAFPRCPYWVRPSDSRRHGSGALRRSMLHSPGNRSGAEEHGWRPSSIVWEPAVRTGQCGDRGSLKWIVGRRPTRPTRVTDVRGEPVAHLPPAACTC